MRARLNSMTAGQELHFLCVEKMAEKMDAVIAENGGEIFARDDRNYGVVISVRKRGQKVP